MISLTIWTHSSESKGKQKKKKKKLSTDFCTDAKLVSFSRFAPLSPAKALVFHLSYDSADFLVDFMLCLIKQNLCKANVAPLFIQANMLLSLSPVSAWDGTSVLESQSGVWSWTDNRLLASKLMGWLTFLGGMSFMSVWAMVWTCTSKQIKRLILFNIPQTQ